MNRVSYLVIVLAVAAIGAGLYLWLKPQAPIETAVAPPPETTEPVPLPAPEPAEPAPPAIQHPLEEAPVSEEAPEQAADEPTPPPDIGIAMHALVGREALLSFFNLDNFALRVVATVDNLGRSHAAPRLWPVNPTPGRFTTENGSGEERIAAANAARYQRFVSMATAIDTGSAASLYKRLYPQFQKAYENLGYPDAYFNDRMVEVIDLLLATPEPAGPLAVSLPEVKTEAGPQELKRPWLRYAYADPQLEALAPGQKILLRMGAEQRQALKAKLADFRRQIARGAPAAP